MGGRYLLGVSAEVRAGPASAAGDEIDVDLELDDAPREVEVPADLAEALNAAPAARAAFDALSTATSADWSWRSTPRKRPRPGSAGSRRPSPT